MPAGHVRRAFGKLSRAAFCPDQLLSVVRLITADTTGCERIGQCAGEWHTAQRPASGILLGLVPAGCASGEGPLGQLRRWPLLVTQERLRLQ